ncbi:unnamed protein product [Brachionus calyciflorus]|uniref:Centrosomal protein of 97 kDa n=1 Tax=Brachionus calyciflorus TaxID=104777 RepID=A0A814JDH4_9BILA|nr:unnamed protein product [Brachionus calyciflorus]
MKVDLSNKNLKKVDYLFLKQYVESIIINNDADSLTDSIEGPIELHVQTICLDNNFLNKLDNLEYFVNLKNLSLANNRLVEIRTLSKLINLEYVNLLNNSLIGLEPFKDLKNLTWLNLSGNQIKSLDCLKSNINLKYLDASENLISSLSDLRLLTNLHTLKLNGNEISSLSNIANYLSSSITNLNLSYNSIEDLNEISFLHPLTNLENLCIDNNPCVSYSNYDSMLNYRPFVLNWCLNLKTLDGIAITPKEYKQAEWLHSQGKGRQFKLGQNTQIIEYLIKNCSSSYNAESIVDLSVKTSQETVKETLKNSSASDVHTSDLISDYHKIMVNNYYSSNDSVNNLGKDLKLFNNLKNSSYVNSFKTDPETDSDRERTNNNKYLEYENRPIKPLDTNAFYKQISEFSEISGEELEEMRNKASRLRPKTSDNLRLPQQKIFSKLPTRQLSLNNHLKLNENKVTRLRKRSKTQEDLSFTKKTPVKQSPVKKIQSSKSVSNTPQKSRNVYSPVKYTKTKLDPKNSYTITPSKTVKTVIEEEKIEIENDKKEDISILSMEIQSKIQKQRQEMRAQREKNLREFKNQLKILDQEREHAEFESFYNKMIPIPVNSTFEDRCATKIQAAFRGYLLRKSKFIRPKIMFLKYKKILRETQNLKENVNELKKAQFELVEFNQKTLSEINSKLEFLNLNDNLQIENEGLKLRVKLLEEKCKTLENKLSNKPSENDEQIEFKYKKVEDENVEPKVEIYPPLKVRLQKLNEKSVALKWNHNPKNLLIELAGYNIYINDELCGTMKSSDTIAAINGIQEEGEYRIYLRSFLNENIESEKSNCVITRVKKKSNNQNKTQASSSLTDETDENIENVANKSANLSNLSGLSDRNESIEKKLGSYELPFQNYLDTSRSFTVDHMKYEEKIVCKPPISPNQTIKNNKKEKKEAKNENDLNAKYSPNEPIQTNNFYFPRDLLVRQSLSFDEPIEEIECLTEQFIENDLVN